MSKDRIRSELFERKMRNCVHEKSLNQEPGDRWFHRNEHLLYSVQKFPNGTICGTMNFCAAGFPETETVASPVPCANEFFLMISISGVIAKTGLSLPPAC
jgi:hypothetical protein